MSVGRGKNQIDLGVSYDDLRQIILDGDAAVLVARAEKIGTELKRDLTTNQIRAIFGTVRQIEMDWDEKAQAEKQQQARRNLILLKPKMAYRAGREGYRGRGLQTLSETLSTAIDLVVADPKAGEVDARTRFGHFVEFFEAILAYHKVAGGN